MTTERPAILAIVPARGGSKRIPRKNIRPFCGRPIIAWSIAAAQAAGVFDAIVVSTDDEEIAAVAAQAGGEAPFRRPLELANDFAPTLPVVAHAVKWWEAERGPVSHACCIYPTAPLIQARYLREGLEYLQADPTLDYAFTATTFPHPIFRALRPQADGTIAMHWPENEFVRSQDLPEAIHDAGQFYWGRGEAFRRRRGFFSSRSRPILLPRRLVQDIDTEEDWQAAELLFELLRKQTNCDENQ